MEYFKSIFIIALASVTLAACGNDTETESTENEQQTEAYQSNDAMDDDGMENDAMAGSETIVSVASGNQNLSTLVTAVKTAERVEMLNSEGPYTVFAPTNAAFSALPDGALDNLLKPENKQKLADILAYHVVEGKVMAADLTDGQMVTTVQGNQLEVSINDGSVMINGATVAQADVAASNGVVHVIDTVLMPSGN